MNSQLLQQNQQLADEVKTLKQQVRSSPLPPPLPRDANGGAGRSPFVGPPAPGSDSDEDIGRDPSSMIGGGDDEFGRDATTMSAVGGAALSRRFPPARPPSIPRAAAHLRASRPRCRQSAAAHSSRKPATT
jgi:hypothetical protein